jgi:hypothetical protein
MKPKPILNNFCSTVLTAVVLFNTSSHIAKHVPLKEQMH